MNHIQQRVYDLSNEGFGLLGICIQLVKVEKLGTLKEINEIAREVLCIPPVQVAIQPESVVEV